jgi:hypothetical protein
MATGSTAVPIPDTTASPSRFSFCLRHDLRVNAFGVCRDGKPVPTLPDRALDDLSGRFAFPAGHPLTAAYALESIAEATRMSERIDAWTHIFPKAYFERLRTMASAAGSLRRWLELKIALRSRSSRPPDGWSCGLSAAADTVDAADRGTKLIDRRQEWAQ